MGNENKCTICGNKVEENSTTKQDCIFEVCPYCGRYIIPLSSVLLLEETFMDDYTEKFNKEKLEKYLFYNKMNRRCAFIGTQRAFDNYKSVNKQSEAFLLTPEMIENWYPKNVYEKIDKILLKLKELSRYDGDNVKLDFETAKILFFIDLNACKNDIDGEMSIQHQIDFLIDAMIELQYITVEDWEIVRKVFNRHTFEVTISPKGLARVYELQKNQKNNKKVFIAMSFNPIIEKIYNAIDSAIRDAKCDVVSMKHRIHNKQIVPEMLRLIKESKILVMDISEPNFGAYYEAGYAQGLNKEVIITCKSSEMKKDKFPCDDKKGAECEILKKYSKPHFDIAQKQILVWEDEADLTEQLTEWIKFLMG